MSISFRIINIENDGRRKERDIVLYRDSQFIMVTVTRW